MRHYGKDGKENQYTHQYYNKIFDEKFVETERIAVENGFEKFSATELIKNTSPQRALQTQYFERTRKQF